MRVRFLAPARAEFREALEQIDAARAGYGRLFRDAAFEAIERIKSHPDAWHLLGDNIRRIRLRRFPYAILYEALSEEILIIAVAHMRRRPGYWRDRIK